MSQESEGTPPPSPGPDASEAGELFEAPLRSAERIDRVLALVRREWLEHPDERFFQMVPNLAARLGVSRYASILEDDSLIEMLERRASR